jgi:pSer/pThr/pTyr-binding forkhead associated (FHA) protein
MKWYLVVERGQHKGQVIPVRREPFLIGREACCHLRPAAATVSRRHCALAARGRNLFVADCHTSNGTFVNGQRLDHEQALQPGDRLQVGPLSFVVTVGGLTMPPVRGELNDEAIGDMLLEIDAKDKARPERAGARSSHPAARLHPQQDTVGAEGKEAPSPPSPEGDPASAAEEILERIRGSGLGAGFGRRSARRRRP